MSAPDPPPPPAPGSAAAQRARRARALAERATERPEAYEFFQLVRLLESAGEGTPVGSDHAPAREAVSLRAHPTLSFPPSPVRSARAGEGGPRELTLAFLGLVGPLGTLPTSYTELVLQRLYLKDTALRDFLDLFHHRAASLFYRAWRKYRLAFAYEHARRTTRGEDDPCTRVLLSLVGLGTPLLAQRSEAPAAARIFYAGHFSARTRSAAGLECPLEAELGAPVRVEEFVGQWIPLSPPARTRLGGTDRDPGHNRLGDQAILGERVWDVQSRVRLHVGPVDLDRFGALLPGGPELRFAAGLARAYLGPSTDFDLEVALAADQVPDLRLGPGPEGAALGRTSWLPAARHAARDLRVRLRPEPSEPSR